MKIRYIFLFIIIFFVIGCKDIIHEGVIIDKYMTGFHNDSHTLAIQESHKVIIIRSKEIYYHSSVGDKIFYIQNSTSGNYGWVVNASGIGTTFIKEWRKL